MGHNDGWFSHCEEGYIMVIVLWATMMAGSATETGWHNGQCFVGHNDSWFIHCESGYIMVSVLWATMIAGSATVRKVT